jgi:outer membrane protein OmpA-like peptidoglycan-associated protein
MKKLLLTFILFAPLLTYSQQNVEFDLKNFPGEKKAVRDALRFIEAGDSYYLAEDYVKYLAIEYYLAAQAFNPNNAQLNFKIGICYLYSPNKYRSLEYLKRAYQINPKIDEHIAFYLGEAYHLNHQFEDAIRFYTMYKSVQDKKIGFNPDKRIQECNTGKTLVANPVRVVIENLGPVVNSRYREYAAVISADETSLLFTSRRPNTTGGLIADDGMYYEDIYSSTKINGIWSDPVRLPVPVNTGEHDATIALSSDGQKLFIYSDKNEGDILITTLNGDKWTKPEPAGGDAINTPYSEVHACFSYDEKAIYFVSDNPENSLGGFDIFVTRIGPDGKWGKPENLGPAINTQYDEEGVYMHPDGKTMYFSSRGHETMGNYDIFKSVFENGKWSKPENLGYPINSADKDVFFVVSASGRHGYYSSGKNDAIGETDIFLITLLGPQKETVLNTEDQLVLSTRIDEQVLFLEPRIVEKAPVFTSILKGIVRDSATGEPLNALLVVTDVKANEVASTFQSNSRTGKFQADLPAGKRYKITATLEGYSYYAGFVDIPISDKNEEVEKNIDLSRLRTGLLAGSIIKGTLTDSLTAKGLSGIIVVKDRMTQDIAGSQSTSSGSGRFRMEIESGKTYDIYAVSEGYPNYQGSVTVPAGAREAVKNIRLTNATLPVLPVEGGTVLKGMVSDGNTNTPLEAIIVISDREQKNVVNAFTTAPSDGKYLTQIPSGKTYGISAYREDYPIYSGSVEIPPSTGKQEIVKDIELIRGAQTGTVLKGTVTDSASGLPLNALVVITDISQKEVSKTLQSNARTGKYRTPLPDGRVYEITSTLEGYNFFMTRITIPSSAAYQEITKDIRLVSTSQLSKVEKVEEPQQPKDNTAEVTILKGTITDAASKIPLLANVVITDNEKNAVVATFQSNSATGKYLVSLPSGKNYGIAVTAEGYLFYSVNVDLPKAKTYQEIVQDVELNKFEIGKKIVLRNIFYDFDKATLRPQSVAELDRLTKLLEMNPKMRIEISSHTDNVGSAAYNEKLSASRALSVVNYLEKKGIRLERLEYKGYGFREPIAPNDTDKGRQLNRRTEFKILSN